MTLKKKVSYRTSRYFSVSTILFWLFIAALTYYLLHIFYAYLFKSKSA